MRAGGQEGRQHRARRRSPAGRRRAGRGPGGAQLLRRVLRSHRIAESAGPRRHAAQARLRPGDRGGLRRGPGGRIATASCSMRTLPGQRYIATTCPAVVGYVERYWPELVGVPRARRLSHGGHGAGAARAPRLEPAHRLHRSLPGQEGRSQQLRARGRGRRGHHLRRACAPCSWPGSIEAASVEASDFDPPHAGSGTLFPLNRGSVSGRRHQRGPGEHRGGRGPRWAGLVRERHRGIRRRRRGIRPGRGSVLQRLRVGAGHDHAGEDLPPPGSRGQVRQREQAHARRDEW